MDENYCIWLDFYFNTYMKNSNSNHYFHKIVLQQNYCKDYFLFLNVECVDTEYTYKFMILLILHWIDVNEWKRC